ncbi:hypothetical protein PROFUN_15875 [Planoprotostelium fungivorum]|uniref:Uncharacterized protein n=1 Tax=Planoprotostelium fungivorum TaxID=1890364 RepID=A0A2P6MSC1_9EUKA|nr:hypothetical protein PROFUN_15875 [Planoprotostelium fungivorum]
MDPSQTSGADSKEPTASTSPDTSSHSRSAVEKVLTDGWTLLSSYSDSKNTIPAVIRARNRVSRRRLPERDRILTVFFQLFPRNFWELLEEVMNTDLAARQDASKTAERYRQPLLSVYEVFQAMALEILERLSGILNEAYRNGINFGSQPVALDETLYAYAVRKAKQSDYERQHCPYPHVYIPRKPHKNGLLCYQAVIMLQFKDRSLPYVIGFAFIRIPQPSPATAATTITSSTTMLQLATEMQSKGQLFLMAIKESSIQNIATALLHELPMNQWRSIHHKANHLLIAAQYVRDDNKKVAQLILTNNYKINTEYPIAPTAAIVSVRTAVESDKMTVNNLKAICAAENHGKRKADYVENIMKRQRVSGNMGEQVMAFKKRLSEISSATASPFHHLYATHFNGVKIHDCSIYRYKGILFTTLLICYAELVKQNAIEK